MQPVAAPAAADTVQDPAHLWLDAACAGDRLFQDQAGTCFGGKFVGACRRLFGLSPDFERKGLNPLPSSHSRNEIGNVDIEYLSDGMTETLIKASRACRT